jgi:hypothetical protein
MLAVVFAASACWSGFLHLFMMPEWLARLIAFAVAVVTLPLAILFVQQIAAPWAKRMNCQQCSSALQPVGGGFVDGTPPSKEELLVYSLVVITPLMFWGVASAFLALRV